VRPREDGQPARVLAVGDPDGHGLIFAEVLTLRRRTATTGASVPNSRAPEKGPPCSTASSRTSRFVFYVTDLARTHRFYAETLGVAFEVEDLENGYLQARLPGEVEFVFLQGAATHGTTPQVVFGLAKGGIDTMVASLAAAGVEIVTPVSEAPGGWSAEFKDPEGHVLSLYQDGGLPR
jgi:glyoxylase I family protein